MKIYAPIIPFIIGLLVISRGQIITNLMLSKGWSNFNSYIGLCVLFVLVTSIYILQIVYGPYRSSLKKILGNGGAILMLILFFFYHPYHKEDYQEADKIKIENTFEYFMALKHSIHTAEDAELYAFLKPSCGHCLELGDLLNQMAKSGNFPITKLVILGDGVQAAQLVTERNWEVAIDYISSEQQMAQFVPASFPNMVYRSPDKNTYTFYSEMINKGVLDWILEDYQH